MISAPHETTTSWSGVHRASAPRPALEEVMRLQLGEHPRPLPLAVTKDAGHRDPGVVVQDRLRHPAEECKRSNVAVAKSFRRLRRIANHEARVRVRQVEGKEVDLALYPTDDADSFTKVGLRMPRRVHQRHEHLALPLTLLQHVILYDGQAAAITVLGAQPLEDPLRGVPLLRWTAPIILQDLIDDIDERVQLRPCRRAATPVSGRNREGQHLRYRPRIQPEPTSRLATAQTLNPHRMAD